MEESINKRITLNHVINVLLMISPMYFAELNTLMISVT